MQFQSLILTALAVASTTFAQPSFNPRDQALNEWTVEFYRTKGVCESGKAGDTQRLASVEGIDSKCHRIRLPITPGLSTSPGAQGAKFTSINKNFKVTLYDDTGCTDPTPDVVKDDCSIRCAPGSSTGAGWMSFKVEKI